MMLAWLRASEMTVSPAPITVGKRASLAFQQLTEGEGRLGCRQLGDGALDLTVDVERPADETDRGGAGATRLQTVDTRLDDAGIAGEPKVVVRAQHDDFAPVDRCYGSHRTRDGVQRLVLAGLAQIVDRRA